MKIHRDQIPARIDVPGALARQQKDFGDATDCEKMAGEYFSMKSGTDLEPLLKGLEGDLCQSPHWGYMINGDVLVRYRDGREESVSAGDLFYWPPGHTVKAEDDADFILFSPQAKHVPVVDHVRSQLGA